MGIRGASSHSSSGDDGMLNMLFLLLQSHYNHDKTSVQCLEYCHVLSSAVAAGHAAAGFAA
jgi:hypothetical protein